jgi:8-oxo-dGTP diphosphatase
MTTHVHFDLGAPEHLPITVKALIWRGDLCLVLRKASNGLWDLPGGRLERGESWWDGLVREVREETALEVLSARLSSHTIKPRSGRPDIFLAFFEACVAGPLPERLRLSVEHFDQNWIDPQSAHGLALIDAHRLAIVNAAAERERAKNPHVEIPGDRAAFSGALAQLANA